MATPRRIQLTTLSVHSAVNARSGADLPHTPGVTAPPAPHCRLELVLFEPDDARCAEFHYPHLTAVRGKGSDETLSEELEEEDGDGDGDELQALARMFQKKYGGAPKRRKDRVQDLVDMGYGYDDTDSFIDNSEAYDELVPACLTTKYGGFYVNVGTLQFRQASGEENETDDFEENVKPKKRKLKEGGEVKMNKKKRKRKEDVRSKGENTKHSVPSGDKKKKASKQQQNLDGMLRKFHKEKLQELQLFSMRKESPPAASHDSSDRAKSVSEDPLSTLVGPGSADDLHQAVMEQDELLTNDQNQENRETLAETSRPSLPDGLPPTLERSLQELTQDDQLTVLIRRLEETVFRVMPEQIHRFNDHCQAHSEARAAKLEAVKEKRAVEGSDEEDDDLSGKRVFGPRKRFRWNEEIREVLCEVVRLKMSSYELDAPSNQSLEDYLKSFLEASVKTLWPRGWMQSRILLIESRRVHAHITGVVARKKSMTVPKSEKGCRGAGVYPGNTGRKAAMEGSCGDPALPTPSLSHQTSSPPPGAPDSGALKTVTPLHASPFPGLPHDGKPAGHTEICRTSELASGALQYGLSHDGSPIHAGGANAPRNLP
ncbi:ubinuclein-1 isoform X2 [Pangasianodon hypophthalmus]|uniref:ubinuclein-1 isoform X2 n=1 Tax=Pangasianodon hypophthalmus TaxID=310915 RepID=UPI000EFF8D61|nr:ubinuclein-1 isoform X2 [Pangasianodon hypophthalmus]